MFSRCAASSGVMPRIPRENRSRPRRDVPSLSDIDPNPSATRPTEGTIFEVVEATFCEKLANPRTASVELSAKLKNALPSPRPSTSTPLYYRSGWGDESQFVQTGTSTSFAGLNNTSQSHRQHFTATRACNASTSCHKTGESNSRALQCEWRTL